MTKPAHRIQSRRLRAQIAVLAFGLSGVGFQAHAQETTIRGADVTPAVHAFLPSLKGAMAQQEGIGAEHRVRPLKKLPLIDGPGPNAPDPVVQSNFVTNAVTSAPSTYEGLGKGFSGYTVQYAPPDTTGAVGLTQFVQWVNVSYVVLNKSTLVWSGPYSGSRLFSGMKTASGAAHPCATSNDGDPIVQYDKIASRWVLSQFAVPGGTAGYWQCVAVSTSDDALGSYNLYAFPYTQFNDYPKLSVWPDGYYVTYNMFTSSFQGAKICAFDRAKMLLGQAATQQCVQLSTSYGSLLPADLDGTTLPPAGSPNYLVNRLSSSLGLWRFKVDWADATKTTLNGPTLLSVAAYKAACGGGACIPQPGTSQKLDSLADRLMFRLAYRVVGGVERMVVNHSVQVNYTNKPNSGNAAIRWYEIQGMSSNLTTYTAATPTIAKQGTYSPDKSFRWMGSVAMDKNGNTALGYSISNATSVKPSLRFATRALNGTDFADDASIVDGTGVQTTNLSRWGDYSHMSIDPFDDCTFWYTGEYMASNGTFNWNTKIAKFKVSTCN